MGKVYVLVEILQEKKVCLWYENISVLKISCIGIPATKKGKKSMRGSQSIFPHHITITGTPAAITDATRGIYVEGGEEGKEAGNEENLLF